MRCFASLLTNYLRMKKQLFYLLLLTSLFCACTDELSISTDVITMTPVNSTKSLDISASSSWTATSSDSWLVLSDAAGKGNKTITLSSQDNYSGAIRIAKINIQAGKLSKTVMVQQGGGEVKLNENFIDNSMSWNASGDSVKTTIDNGYLNIRCDAKYYSFLAGTKSLVPFYTSDYMISTKFKILFGTAPFGLTFGYKDASNFYRILVLQNGSILVSQIVNRSFQTVYSSTIASYQNENTLSLVKIGDQCTIYFNDVNMGKFNFAIPFGSYVGFYVQAQTTVMVDYLKINQY